MKMMPMIKLIFMIKKNYEQIQSVELRLYHDDADDYNEEEHDDNSVNECFAQKGEEWGKSEHYVRRSRQPHAFCQVAPGLHTYN